ncbi:hypothetical protein [Bacillus alkalicellulosilyticus]|uniref:hypothetical protein n=1 Tax=Alkalihalobacterium alkalicellulosilyticum TaxID=1912214 RepID=UPI0009977224|nr:hypothetical protein [Bacillus alkalicellulosilyticus]
MKKMVHFNIVFIFIIMLSACGFIEKRSETAPSLETPFPIDLETELKDYTFLDNNGVITLQISLHTNKESDENVVLYYQLFRDENNQWVQQNQQELLKEKIKVSETKMITCTLQPLRPGRYRLLLTAEYATVGKENSILLSISEQGELTMESNP